MNKTVIATALGLIAIAPAVTQAAEATLYGRVWLEMYNAGKTTANGSASTFFGDDSSNIGIKGSEKINDNVTGYYKVEAGYNAMNGSIGNSGSAYHTPSPGFYTRFGYLGVKDKGFGSLTIGRQVDYYYSLIEDATYVTNVVYAPINPINANGYTYRVDAINYLSPDMNGLQIGLAYVGAGTDSKGQQQGMIQVGAKYAFGSGGYVNAAFMSIPKHNVGINSGWYLSSLGATRLGDAKNIAGIAAGYQFGAFGIDANFQRLSPRADGPSQLGSVTGTAGSVTSSVQTLAVQGSYTAGDNYVYAQYSQAKWAAISKKTANRVTLGLNHHFSKQFSSSGELQLNNRYANSELVDSANAKANAVIAVGMRYNF